MGESGVRDRVGRSRRPGFDLCASKLHRPETRPGTIRRSSLVRRLAGGRPGPIVSVVAPPGYRKTTLLAQWAEADSRAFAWVSVDQGDNDPKVLLTYVAEALDAPRRGAGRSPRPGRRVSSRGRGGPFNVLGVRAALFTSSG